MSAKPPQEPWKNEVWATARREAERKGERLDPAAVERRLSTVREMRMPMRRNVKRKRLDQQQAYLRHIERTYGLTRTGYLRLFQEQDCKCAVCGKDLELFSEMNSPVVDHCHKTGKVRGILCQPCNVRVGVLEVDLEKEEYRAAVSYLTKHR